MTCIVAIAQNGVVYMASDHAASDDKTGWILSRKEPKVFKNGQYGIAFTDSFRMGQILRKPVDGLIKYHLEYLNILNAYQVN